MPEPLNLNTIEQLGRALLAVLAPVTGVRATGGVTVTALPGAEPVDLPKNTYLRPIISGQLREGMLFKTTDDHTVGAGTSEAAVGITSNVGGVRHNLPLGTVLRFDPVPDGFEPLVTLDASMTDGSDDGALIRSVAFFEELDAANPEKDVFAALLSTPAVMIVWLNSDPAEGALSGLSQGSNRGSRAVKFWKEHFVLYVVASRLGSDTARRQEGLLIEQVATRLLTDRMQNDDGEQLSTIGGGVDIVGRQRFRRSERHYIYSIRLRVNRTMEKAPDARVFELWARTHYRAAVPGGEAPEPIQDLDVVDAVDLMP